MARGKARAPPVLGAVPDDEEGARENVWSLERVFEVSAAGRSWCVFGVVAARSPPRVCAAGSGVQL